MGKIVPVLLGPRGSWALSSAILSNMSASRDDERARRAAARAGWPVSRYPLGGEPPEDLSGTTTAAERLSMMWRLALDAWAMSGRPLPTYSRSEAPGRIIRPGDE